MSRMFELMRQAQLDGDLLQKPVAPTTASGATNSHNFELLRQAQKEELLFDTAESKAVVPSELAPSAPPSSSACGETFKLVHRLFLAEAALAPRVVVFCAVDQRNEDSCTCARAAELLASQPQNPSVCVVDANVARPSLHTYFRVDNGGGLSRAILDDGPVMGFTQPLDGDRLRLMSAGAPRAGEHALEMLASSRLRARITELRTKFDYILIDAPPAKAGSPTAYLAKLVDGFILLIEPSFTPQQAARNAKNNIEAAGGRVLGVVLLRRELRFRSTMARGRRSPKAAGNF
ncbi:MAG: protein-tyrosine kinase [Acidobacteriaceae bacterium]|nr:protein-tyrosine kinase [Acidobacteriaceae bacterium]